jgi:hypothetical protein
MTSPDRTKDKKNCNKCGESKSLECFHVNNSNKDGRFNICKVCISNYNKRKTATKNSNPDRTKSCSKCKEKKHIKMFQGSPTKSGMYRICKTCRDLQRSITEKVCSSCNKVKSTKEFALYKTGKDGFASQCKSCNSKYSYEYYRKNKLKKSQYDKTRYAKKREEISKRNRSYYLKGREKALIKQRQWAKNNPHLVRLQSSQKRANKRNAIPPWLNKSHKEEIKLMHLLAKSLERQTGNKYHVDHIIPLKHKEMCGLHVPWNLRVITEEENMRKNNRFLPELGLTAC